jgi:uncharacterized protein YbjT (DUF2867 family)
MESIMSILVVSGSGRVAKDAALQLSKRGLPVSALMRGGANHPVSAELLEAGVKIVAGDLASPESLRKAVKGFDTVICSATSMPSAANDGIRRVDHDGTLALIDAAEEQGVKRFVYVSYSGNVNLNSPLEKAKRDCEDQLFASRIQAVILRPSYFMEVWLSPMLGFDAANGSARIYGSGERKVSYISSADVADFAVAAATNKFADQNTTLELGGPEALSQLDAVKVFEQQLGNTIKLEHVPVEALRAQYESADPLQRTFGALMLAYAGGDVVRDAAANAQRYGVGLRSVAEYASRVVAANPVA